MIPAQDNLDTRLRAHYRRECLAPDALARLRPLATSPGRRRLPRMAAAAVLLVATLATLCVLLFQHFQADRWHELARSAATEIALNHNKNLAVEFEARTFRELEMPMAKLDFAVVPPACMDREGLRLAGARYCHIGGRIAAQIRLTDPHDERLTLYEFRPGAEHEGLQESSFDIAGVRVRVWLESGLVMGLARPLR